MNSPTAMHQIGHFIVRFQGVETLLNELIILMASDVDREIVTILVHELEFGKRVATADVLFGHVVRTRYPNQEQHIKRFHQIADDLIELSKVRNALVHSRYNVWIDVAGRAGVIRSNSRLKPAKGVRIEEEFDMLPEAFERDLDYVMTIVDRLEEYRILLINWLYPNPS